MVVERSLTLRGGKQVFENRTLWPVFGPMRYANGKRKRLHNKELHGLYSSLCIVRINISKRLRWAIHLLRMVESKSRLLSEFQQVSEV